MVADAMEIYDSFVKPLPRPHILFGHSMGGCVGMRVLQKTDTTFDSAVLSAPMFGWDYPALVAQFAATCMILLVEVRITPLELGHRVRTVKWKRPFMIV